MLVALWPAATRVSAEELRGVVVDQTEAPLPGVKVQVLEGTRVTGSTVTSADGRFRIGSGGPAARVSASLKGFRTVVVALAEAGRIVLPLESATDSAEVTATATQGDSPAAAGGAELARTTVLRLPTPTQHVREALPLLPSVVRGPDGLLRIDGVRPHDSPLLIDGFNVTDPATGVSSIDLPVESVRSVGVLRDPMTVTFGRALGSLTSIETRGGGDSFEAGVQGFIPRPRLTGGGFGRLEGFSPRAYAAGRASRAVRYFASAEFDFDRIPVPGVTTATGKPDTVQVGGAVFVRTDIELSDKHTVTAEGVYFPARKTVYGLSPLRAETAAPTLLDRDAFFGLVDRRVLGAAGVLTLRLGILSHRTEVRPHGPGEAELAPTGWRGGSFSSLQRTGTRLEGSLSWQRAIDTSSGLHDVTVESTFDRRRLRGLLSERPVSVLDHTGALVRSIQFGPAADLAAKDQSFAIAVRDLWRANESLRIDGGVRADCSAVGGSAPSARIGFRYTAGKSAETVLKGGLGTFVGSVPLSVPAFVGFPERVDQKLGTLPGAGGAVVLRPLVASLALPRAFAANARLERVFAPGWDAFAGVTIRNASRLANLEPRAEQGSLLVSSTGRSAYREVEAGLRHTWGDGNLFFLSYTRSSARGDINDFGSLFANGDVEVLEPGAAVRLAADAPHRVLAWGTVDLPAKFGLSPAIEWHSGFPYSALDARRSYIGKPHSDSFPAFFALDLVVYKTFGFRGRTVRVNVQLFNVTNHFNPRDVFAVAGGQRFGTFANSVGPTVRGDIAVSW